MKVMEIKQQREIPEERKKKKAIIEEKIISKAELKTLAAE